MLKIKMDVSFLCPILSLHVLTAYCDNNDIVNITLREMRY